MDYIDGNNEGGYCVEMNDLNTTGKSVGELCEEQDECEEGLVCRD
jgi:hypothetical protein